MQAAAVGEARVDEGLRPVQASPRPRQHPLDELLHLGGLEHRAGELGIPVAGHEHPSGLVDPDLLHRGVVEERGDGSEPDDPLPELDHVGIGERRETTRQVPIPIVGDHLVDERVQDSVLVDRQVATHEELAHIRLDELAGAPHAHPANPCNSSRSSRNQRDRGATVWSGRASHTTRSKAGSVGNSARGAVPVHSARVPRAVLQSTRRTRRTVDGDRDQRTGLATTRREIGVREDPATESDGIAGNDQQDLVGLVDAHRGHEVPAVGQVIDDEILVLLDRGPRRRARRGRTRLGPQ